MRLSERTRIFTCDRRAPGLFGASSKRQILALLALVVFLGAIILLSFTFIELLNSITDTTITNPTRFTAAGSAKMADKVYAYVPHHRQKVFEDKGWVYDGDLGYPHAAYASLYRWAGEGLPVMPENDIGVIREPKKHIDIDVEVNKDEEPIRE